MPVLPLLHEIFPSGDAMLALLVLVWAVGVLFAGVGVFVSRRYGAAALAMTTVGFCLLIFVGLTSVERAVGGLVAIPIMAGFLQAVVIARRTRNGGGRSQFVESLIGGTVFLFGIFATAFVGALFFG